MAPLMADLMDKRMGKQKNRETVYRYDLNELDDKTEIDINLLMYVIAYV